MAGLWSGLTPQTQESTNGTASIAEINEARMMEEAGGGPPGPVDITDTGPTDDYGKTGTGSTGLRRELISMNQPQLSQGAMNPSPQPIPPSQSQQAGNPTD